MEFNDIQSMIREHSRKYSEYLNKINGELSSIDAKIMETLQKRGEEYLEITDAKNKFNDKNSKILEDRKQLKEKKKEKYERLRLEKEEIKEGKLKLNEKVQERNSLLNEISSLEYQINVEKERQSNIRNNRESILEKRRKYVELQKEVLGIGITCTKRHTFIITFTMLNREDPNKKYLLEMSIDEENRYKLHSASPLPVENLLLLEDRLNETGNYLDFLAYLRNLFCGLD